MAIAAIALVPLVGACSSDDPVPTETTVAATPGTGSMPEATATLSDGRP